MEHTYDFDLAVIGSGPGGQKAAIMAAKLGHKVCVVDSKAMVGGVCVNTGTIPSKTLREAVLVPDRDADARPLRRELPGQGRDHDLRSAGPAAARGRPRDRGHPLPVAAQPHRADSRHGVVHRPAHAVDRHRGSAGAPHPDRAQDRDRHRYRSGPTEQRRVRRSAGAGLRPDPGAGEGARLPRRRGRRGDRRRVRLDVRRLGHPGHPGGEAAADAGLLRPRDRRVAQVPPA